jgi:hypothetical protein
MAQAGYTPIQMYHSTTTGAVPVTGNLLVGELAVNVTDRLIYTKDGAGNVVAVGGSGAVAGGAIVINETTADESYTMPVGTNGFSVGPITVASGVTITISAGQRWVVI